ncbi:MAG: hypothetical protein LBN26_01325 [Christensenellaceae bacterium]|jgi:uncharacterized iron-regulated membrane protein|nr:hypothetical protein [Christensenellaceae bacterium]
MMANQYDKMDELLGAIAREADEQVDYRAAFANVLAAAKIKQRQRRVWITRTLSAAAMVAVTLGIAGALYNRGFGAAKSQENQAGGAQPMPMAESARMAPIPEDGGAQPYAYAAAEDASQQEAPAAGIVPRGDSLPEPAPAEEAEALWLEVPPEADEKPKAAGQAARKQASLVWIGEAKDALLALQGDGSIRAYAAQAQDVPLEAGQALLCEDGSYALWNTGEGLVAVYFEGKTYDEALALLQKSAK